MVMIAFNVCGRLHRTVSGAAVPQRRPGLSFDKKNSKKIR
jgi:hypothetical protein